MNGAPIEPRPVFVCERCGTGFLRYTGKRHVEPEWMLLDGTQGPDCFGEIVVKKWSPVGK